MAKGCGQGSVYQQIDGRWYAAVDLSQQNSKRRRKYPYGAAGPEVREQLIKVQQDQQRGLPVPAERQTLAEFMDHWLEDSVRLSVAPLTYEQYAQHVRLYLAPALGHIRLFQLNPQHVQAFIKARLSDGLSARTVKLSLLILRMALKQAVRWETISRNVAALVDPPRVQRPEVKPFSDVEARKFLEAVRGKRLEAAYLLLLSLGLRRGETLGLRWQDIDLEKRTACVRQTLQRVGGRSIDGQPSRPMFKAPKSARSRRTLPLSESLVKALKTHRERQLEERLGAGSRWHDTGLVFTTGIGTPVEPRRLVADFKRMLQEAGLPTHTRLHDLRHSAASLLLVQGVQPRVVMELLGHSQISLTMDTYSHVIPAATREAAEKMEAILSRAD